MAFIDRADAGRQLAQALERYRDQHPLVLAIPRGGVEVGYQVASYLNTDFSLIVTRKLGMPGDPELGFGAIAEDGSKVINNRIASQVPAIYRQKVVDEQKEEIQRRIDELRGGKPLPDIEGRTVILVDDGIATGATLRASIMACRNMGADRIVVAAPISGPDTKQDIAGLVDDIVVLETPTMFRAVAQGYQHWHDVSDEGVREIMERWEKETSSQNRFS